MYDQEAINEIREYLIAVNQTLAVAESVTSGHLQAALSLGTDASQFFQGGITAYNIGQKCRHLLVEPTHALAYNCVSVDIAEQMARQVAKIFLSDWGIGITGYASPVEGVTDENLFAYYSINHLGNKIENGIIETAPQDSMQVQILFANEVLKSLARSMRSHITA